MMPEFAVIVPTFNERDNVIPLVDALQRALAGIDFEIIFVDDDSPDGTAAEVRALSARVPNVRVLQRINRRGLASAAIEGMMASSAAYLAVIDGDMQHDETVLPVMLQKLRAGDLDIVIGTRNTAGGSMGHFASWRVALSNLGRRFSTVIAHTEMSDPMSGFFMLRRQYLEEVVRSLSVVGFKVLLDLLASSERPVRVGEVGYTFRNRTRGESKLNTAVCLEYIELVLDKLIGDFVPVRYAFFGLIGAIGVFVQLALVAWLAFALPLVTAQAVGCSCAMILNYALNNRLTFRAGRLRGWAWVRGLLSFVVACSIGLYCNLHVAHGLYAVGFPWSAASLAGIFVGSVWNYGVSSMLVWRVNRRYRRAVKPSALRHPSPATPAAEIIGLH